MRRTARPGSARRSCGLGAAGSRRRPERAGPGIRPRRRRLGPWRRDEPVGRVRTGQGRPRLPADPLDVLPRHRYGVSARDAAPASPGPRRRRSRLRVRDERDRRVRRRRQALPDPLGDDHGEARPEAARGQGRQAARARGAGDDPRGEGGVPLVRREGVPRRPACGERLGPRPARQRRRRWRRTCSESSPERCRRTGRSRRSRRRRSRRAPTPSGTSSAEGRSTSTRTGAARCTTASTSEAPGPTQAVQETAGQILTYRRGSGADLLLLLERRQDDQRARRVRPRSPLPRLGRRPVGRGLAEPCLDATAPHAAPSSRPASA